MELYSTYSVKIKDYNHIFNQSVKLYREAVSFFLQVCLNEWDTLGGMNGVKSTNAMEALTIRTAKRPQVKYDFSKKFYKFPSYLRRSAIAEAYGKASAYMSLLENYEKGTATGKPGYPRVGCVYPVLYRGNTFVRLDDYTANIKVYTRNTWDWIRVNLRKSDVDYILKHCSNRKECSPTLQKRGKEWFLDFPFSETVKLSQKKITRQTILAVDLGINSPCVCSVMKADGTVTDRAFLKLPIEKDHLKKATNRLRGANRRGNLHTPGLWARAKGINDDMSVKTAAFILEKAKESKADVIVFEHLDLAGKKKGSKKQRLHLWKARYVQEMVTAKAHREGVRVSRVNARKTSALAFDGSGMVERNIADKAGRKNYSICRFQSGKIYHCDLNATYNIGARYYIREILKSLPETERLETLAKVPECSKRSTCTLSTLISLYAVTAA